MIDSASEKSDSPQDSSKPLTKVHTRVSLCLALVGAILLSLSIPALWVNNLVTSTDAWVETFAPLAAEPAIQDELASQSSQAIKERVHAVSLAEKALPEELQILAIPVGSMVNTFIDEATADFIQSPQFYTLWQEINTLAHSAFSRIFLEDGEERILSLTNGELTLDLTLLINAVEEKLESQGLELSALNAEPEEGTPKGQLTLFQFEKIASIQSLLSSLSILAITLIVLALVSLVASLLVVQDKRKAGLQICIACFVALIISRFLFMALQSPLASSLVPAGGGLREAISAAYGIILLPLTTIQETLLVIIAISAIALFLAGPSRWAASIRKKVKGFYEKGKSLVPLEKPQEQK